MKTAFFISQLTVSTTALVSRRAESSRTTNSVLSVKTRSSEVSCCTGAPVGCSVVVSIVSG